MPKYSNRASNANNPFLVHRAQFGSPFLAECCISKRARWQGQGDHESIPGRGWSHSHSATGCESGPGWRDSVDRSESQSSRVRWPIDSSGDTWKQNKKVCTTYINYQVDFAGLVGLIWYIRQKQLCHGLIYQNRLPYRSFTYGGN